MNKQELVNYVVNSHVRNELEINELLRLIRLLPDDPELNENQQVVLEWLKNSDNSPFALVSALDDDFVGIETIYSIPTNVREAFEKLSAKEQFEVLAAFAEWGMKEVAE